MPRLMRENNFIPVKVFFFRRKAIDLRRQVDHQRFAVFYWRHPAGAARADTPRGTKCISRPLSALA